MADPYTALHITADKIKSQVPPELWVALFRAFEGIYAREAERLVDAPPDRVFTAQGRVQTGRDIVRALHECSNKARTYEAAAKK